MPAGIAYLHHRDLAPTTELRQLQYAEDARQGVGKRSRRALAPDYSERYTSEILAAADLPGLLAELPLEGAAALLCVERDPEACHRSLIAQRLGKSLGVVIEHLRPDTPTCCTGDARLPRSASPQRVAAGSEPGIRYG